MRNGIDVLDKLYELANTRNIHLVDSKLPAGARSVYIHNGITQLIMIDGELSTGEKISEIAFCLGHAILHKNLNFNIFINKDKLLQKKLDMESSKFANKLLVLIG